MATLCVFGWIVAGCAPSPPVDETGTSAPTGVGIDPEPVAPRSEETEIAANAPTPAPEPERSITEPPAPRVESRETASAVPPEPEAPASPVPASAPRWWQEDVSYTDDGRTLIPGVAEARSLRAARDAALDAAWTTATRLGVDDDIDDGVQRSASARLDGGLYRYWVLLETVPTK